MASFLEQTSTLVPSLQMLSHLDKQELWSFILWKLISIKVTISLQKTGIVMCHLLHVQTKNLHHWYLENRQKIHSSRSDKGLKKKIKRKWYPSS